MGCNPLRVACKAVFKPYTLKTSELTINILDCDMEFIIVVMIPLVDDVLVEHESDIRSSSNKVNRECLRVKYHLILASAEQVEFHIVVVKHCWIALLQCECALHDLSVRNPYFVGGGKRISVKQHLKSIRVGRWINCQPHNVIVVVGLTLVGEVDLKLSGLSCRNINDILLWNGNLGIVKLHCRVVEQSARIIVLGTSLWLIRTTSLSCTSAEKRAPPTRRLKNINRVGCTSRRINKRIGESRLVLVFINIPLRVVISSRKIVFDYHSMTIVGYTDLRSPCKIESERECVIVFRNLVGCHGICNRSTISERFVAFLVFRVIEGFNLVLLIVGHSTLPQAHILVLPLHTVTATIIFGITEPVAWAVISLFGFTAPHFCIIVRRAESLIILIKQSVIGWN